METAPDVHLPSYITPPGETDVLFIVVVVATVIAVLVLGSLYFRLHALPEHMAHRSSRTQYQLVAILALIALFTHNSLFWIAALLLAAVQLPDFMTPLRTIAESAERMAPPPPPAPEPLLAGEDDRVAPADDPGAEHETDGGADGAARGRG